MQSFADFAAKHIGKSKAKAVAQQFNKGFWSADYTTLAYRSDLSPKGEEGKKN